MESSDDQPKPRNVRDLYADEEPTPAPPKEEPPSPLELKADEEDKPQDGDIPRWVLPYLPDGFRVPRGKQVSFMRFKSAWTDEPAKGVETAWPFKLGSGKEAKTVSREELTRVFVCWPISDAEEKQALERTRGKPGRALDEYTKQMMRVVDGKRVDWTANWAREPELLVAADTVWREIGPKCRQVLKNLYTRTHNLDDAELADFLVNGLVITSAVAS